MKRITKKQWRESRIFNSYDIAANGMKFFVSYSPQVTGRAYRSASWQVIHLKRQTDPNAHWTDGGHKTFDAYNAREQKEPKRLEAIKWASKEFGIKEWECDPFGDYHPKGTMEKVARKLGLIK